MHRYPAIGQERDQIEDQLIIRLSTSAVTNFLLMQVQNFVFPRGSARLDAVA